MPLTVTSPSNPEIALTYGKILSTSQKRLKDLTIEQFEPAIGTIIIQKFDPETLTEGGIHIPEMACKKPALGTVMVVYKTASGPECPYKRGDIVVIRSEHCGSEIAVGKSDVYHAVQFRGCIDDEVLGRFPAEAVEKGSACD